MHSGAKFGTLEGMSLPFLMPEPPPAALGSLLRVSRRAMATTFEVALPAHFPNGLAAAEAALDLVDDLEDQLTVYRESSEVAALNREAVRGLVRVESGLFQFLNDCATLASEAGGAFDPASGALVRAWADSRREGRIPTGAELAWAREQSGFRHVLLDAATESVKFLRPGLALNFGAVGKGYALDRAANLLRREWGVASALLSAGGSSVRAIGTPPREPRGWLASVRHPVDDDATLGAITLRDESLGTSAATFQFFEFQSKRYGHLLDPRTGQPASGTLSASVVAPTAAAADALSTAAFVRGGDWLAGLCRERPELAGVVLADRPGAVPTVENLADGRYQPPGRRIHYSTATDD